MVSAQSSILVGCLGSVAWVRITGSANHENAGQIREFLRGRMDNGWTRFVIDLKDCVGIDSTFIGMLYRLAVDVISKEESGSVEVINPNDRNERSIRKLGLDSLIQIDSDGSKWAEERSLIEENLKHPLCQGPTSREERAELVLDAHEALIEANEENRNRFCDVVEYLKQDLQSQTSER